MIQEKSGFWDSIDPTPGNSGDERTYNAGEMTIPFEYLVTNGVQTGGGFLEVTPGNYDYTTLVAPGMAWIKGRWYLLEDDGTGGAAQKILLHDAPIQYNRIDRIVLRYDANYTLAARKIVAVVLKGEETAAPVAPALTRNDEIYELSLAHVTIKPGQPAILETDITEERFDSALCGIAEFAPQPELQPRIDEIIEELQEYINSVLSSGGLPANQVNTAAPSGQASWTNAQAYLAGLKGLVDGLQSSKAAAALEFTAWVMPADFTGTGPWVQTIAVAGITAAMVPFVDVHLDGGPNDAIWLAGYACLDRVVTGAGSITVYCVRKKPTYDFGLRLRVVQ